MASVWYSNDDRASQDACIWGGWTTGTSSTSACANTDVWEVWVGDAVDTTCTSDCGFTTRGATVWRAWVTTSGGSTHSIEVRRTECAKPRPETAEERAARQTREAGAAERRRQADEEARVAAEKRKADEAAADKVAEELLLQHLDADQKAEYAKDKSFHVRTRTGRRYRVRRAWGGHVERIGDCGRAVERFCVHPCELVPLPDNQLIAKIMLECDEDNFTRIANRSPISTPAGAT